MPSPHTLFIADLHLSADRPDITAAFLRFLQEQAVKSEALYILGDLFEVWIGDDNPEPLLDTVATALTTLSRQLPIYFIHGNRDFVLRQAYASRAGMQLLPQQQVIDLYGTPTLIMHGDSLCTLDIAYQRFRKWWNQPWWQWLLLKTPLPFRQAIAAKARRKSAANKARYAAQQQVQIMDVTPDEVTRVMAEAGVQKLIHGHTHRPAVHQIEVNGKPGERYVLGDWYSQSSYLTVSADNWQLVFTPLTDH
ncbi:MULTISPECIES: UDP-2,3-diacylglucosamine diphosphatase [unclassified Arsukibacterium]|uniref:UDP-2,3-diacylglucosamine diphosphatase n=1 Tax=unclassified Arsukibacterium TaxID=2635278 RepID=UPI000C88F9D2|nr:MULTISPECIES: UDP-2,3-diacylglucosamine diphosphatase [unclassified Arsukibacterium]MAA94426.1 UDP-2,3-diacylglucosamine diphosphatase [Rheinheimera sp.]HAW91491.1 UDP-2,3-diacylglucosamine diphosphatase [Candidatus Azambacteria bacterium]|tara:strand:+ start:264 stop:1013 length:750 start_codon:yes stop_codon:yes gene_type:complete